MTPTVMPTGSACVWGLGVIFSLASVQWSISFRHAVGSSIGLLAIRSPVHPQRHSVRSGITRETAGCCIACMCVQCAPGHLVRLQLRPNMLGQWSGALFRRSKGSLEICGRSLQCPKRAEN